MMRSTKRGDIEAIERVLIKLGELTFKQQRVRGLDWSALSRQPFTLNYDGVQDKLLRQIVESAGYVTKLNKNDYSKFLICFQGNTGWNSVGRHSTQFYLDNQQFKDTVLSSIKSIKFIHSQFVYIDSVVVVSTVAIEYANQDKPKEYYILQTELGIRECFLELCALYPFINIEERLRKPFRETETPVPAAFWGNETLWGGNNHNTQAYDNPENGIDNTTLSAMTNHVFNQAMGGSLLVLDVGGGNGRLADKVMTAAANANIKLQYILIEPDRHQYEQAKSRLKNKSDHQVVVYHGYLQDFINNILLQNAGLMDELRRKEIQFTLGSVDAIISSGGPLNVEVVSHPVARKNLQDMKSLLSPGGRIVATGLSMLHFSRNEFLNKFGLFSYQTVDEKLGTYRHSTRFNQSYVLGLK